MNMKDYVAFELAVSTFALNEGIINLTQVAGEHDVCELCGEDTCQDGFFSHYACDCCGTKLAGDLYHASGYNPKDKVATCYDVCIDCLYYFEFGQLDDRTMLEIERS